MNESGCENATRKENPSNLATIAHPIHINNDPPNIIIAGVE